MSIKIIIFSLAHKVDSSGKEIVRALMIEVGKKPQYIRTEYSSLPSHYPNVLKGTSIDHELIKDSFLFIWDPATLKELERLLQIKLTTDFNFTLFDLMKLFYPSSSATTLEEIGVEIGYKLKRTLDQGLEEIKIGRTILQDCWKRLGKLDPTIWNKVETVLSETDWKYILQKIKRHFIYNPELRILPLDADQGYPLWSIQKEEKNGSEPFRYSSDWVIGCFQGNGLLSRSFSDYEERSSQIKMASAVIKGFMNGSKVMIEAGTGTGKSIGYLIPAIWWSLKQKERVLIATQTITLQEQLYTKDIPKLESLMPFPFRTQLLKGKGNYLCFLRLHENPPTENATYSEKIAYLSLLIWSQETRSGDLNELSSLQVKHPLEKKYSADNPNCEATKCYYFSKCFLYKERKKAEEADLLIVNHSLLLSDIKTNNKVLPEYHHLIVDEAHHLHNAAMKQLGFEVTLDKIIKIFERLIFARSSVVSLLRKNKSLWSLSFHQINWQEFYQQVDELYQSSEEGVNHAKELFGLCDLLLLGRTTISIYEDKIGQSSYRILFVIIENLVFQLNAISQIISKLSYQLANEGEIFYNIISELNKPRTEILQLKEGFDLVLINRSDRISFLERNRVTYFKNTFINVSDVLRGKIFDLKDTVILTSATLTVNDDFQFLARDIGLEHFVGVKLESPFNYAQQMQFCVVKDIPHSLPEDMMISRTSHLIHGLATIMKGRLLVLFTSHRLLQKVYWFLDGNLSNRTYKIFAQGISGERDHLVREFQSTERSILLGTNSYWEGIDLPGDQLKCVVIIKLPFWPPDYPVLEARANYLSEKGVDPFLNLHLPEAIMRLKQGFGRLIRSKNDTGVVILLDNRILTKEYGKYFLKSLPISSYFTGNTEEILDQVVKWT